MGRKLSKDVIIMSSRVVVGRGKKQPAQVKRF